MVTFSAGRTNRTVLQTQSRDSSLRVSRPSVHVGPPSGCCYSRCDSTGVSRRYPTPLMATDVSIKHERFSKNYRQLHRSSLRNTRIHAHTTSRTFPSSDTSLGSPTVALSEAGDFVEYLTGFNEASTFLDRYSKNKYQISQKFNFGIGHPVVL